MRRTTPPQLLLHLSLILFMKRNSAPPGEHESSGAPEPGSDDDTAFAPQAETGRAISNALQIRHEFLWRKNIADLRHVLSESERGELVKGARSVYENTAEQLALQAQDRVKWQEKGLTAKEGPDGTKGSRGAPQRASKGSRGQGAGKGSKGQEKGKTAKEGPDGTKCSRGARQPAGK